MKTIIFLMCSIVGLLLSIKGANEKKIGIIIVGMILLLPLIMLIISFIKNS
ncbi:hypothetical protein [Clostridium sp. ZBS13]|uniref:hypothetical protein n=1 Tax=Clostridium sp. ZBS13 TaxID=2949971 RepID=UPI002079D253|nr:hypothetical protein [Clostridium sp. ZBS13]